MIRFYNVYKKYPREIMALDDINFEVEEGEFVFLTGPSGSGKTTIIKMLIREELPSAGRIFFDNDEITRYSRGQTYNLRRKIGVIFQDYKLISDKTSFENISFVMEAAGHSQRHIDDTVPHLLDIVGLADRMDAFPRELSGGEKQRVAIARALANNPKLLIADEPTGNLDPQSASDIVQILKKINEWGTTILMSTHGINMVQEMGQRVLKVENGRLIEDSRSDTYITEKDIQKNEFESKLGLNTEDTTESGVIIVSSEEKKEIPTEVTDEIDPQTEKVEPTESILEPNKEASVAESQEELTTSEPELVDEDNSNETSTPKELPVAEGLASQINEGDIEKSEIEVQETETKTEEKQEVKEETKEIETKENSPTTGLYQKPKPKIKIRLVDKKKKSEKSKKFKPTIEKKVVKKEKGDLEKLKLEETIEAKLVKSGFNTIEKIISSGFEEISKVDLLTPTDMKKIKTALTKFITDNS